MLIFNLSALSTIKLLVQLRLSPSLSSAIRLRARCSAVAGGSGAVGARLAGWWVVGCGHGCAPFSGLLLFTWLEGLMLG